jgi:murein L,D-transpeptidase YcbB/YkuD
MKRVIGVMAVLSLLTAVGAVVGTGTAEAAASCTSYTTFYGYNPDNTYWAQRLPTVGSGTRNVNCVLGVGNQGSAVRTLQHALNRCYAPPYNNITAVLKEDGIYGSKTQTAVKAVQNFNGIPHDGVYGPQTRSYMNWPSTYSDGVTVWCLSDFVDWPY